MSMRLWTSAAALCLVTAAVIVAQEPAVQFRSGVDLIQVDVSVLDKDRHPVRGLTAADFTIKEDGKVRPVAVFTPVDLGAHASPPATAAAWTRDAARDVVTNDVAREGRLVTIVMDRTIRFGDQKLARTIATRVVDELDPTDLAALVFTNQFSTGGKAVNFSADRARLRAAIQEPFAPALTAVGSDLPLPPLDDPDNLESGDCLCGVCVLDSLTRIADSIRDVSARRKVVIFIGTYVRVFESASESGRGTQCSVQLGSARQRLQRAVALSNVSLDVFDAVGIETFSNSPIGGTVAAVNRRQANFRSLAANVGGRTIMSTNTPEAMVRSVLDETASYYLLGFEPQAKSDGRAHDIDVAVNRKGVTVQRRSAYIAPQPPERAEREASARAAASTPNLSAVTGVLPKTGLSLALGVASFASPDPKGKGITTVTVLVEQPAGTRVGSRAAGAPAPKAEIAVAAFDRRGQSVAVARQPVTFTGPATDGRLRYEIVSHLALEPGHYDLRVGASDDGVTDAGSVFTTIDVPDLRKGALTMADPLLFIPGVDSGAINDTVAELLPFTPTARRAFTSADRPSAFVRLYQNGNSPAAPVAVHARILDAADRAKLDTTTIVAAARFASGRAADYQIELPLASLSAGEYLLRVEATLESTTARRDVRFTVKTR